VIRGALDRLRRGLAKTRADFLGKLGSLLPGRVRLDADTLDQIEGLLLRADMGVAASLRITRSIEKRLKEEGGEATLAGVLEVIRSDIRQILLGAKPKVHPPGWADVDRVPGAPGTGKAKKKKGKKGREPTAAAAPPALPAGRVSGGPADEAGGAAAAPASARQLDVILVVGVNGTGKTTSIAKLAALLKERGHLVLLAAADTFRAAAVEQLETWAQRIGVPCVQQGQGGDPAAVVFDALSAAEARGHDVVIVDTAGRLHTKVNLMAELAKVERVIEKKTGRPPQTLLVVDANTGQNGLAQARIFAETVPVDGLILAKLDGTAKGGIVVAIAEEMGLPVRYVGTGETAADLAEFDVDTFLEALFSEWTEERAEAGPA
jgi:fused signal recognition particle receptor